MRTLAEALLAVTLGALCGVAVAGCAPTLPSAADERAAMEVVRAAARDVGLDLPPVVAIGYSVSMVTCNGNPGVYEGCSYARERRCDVTIAWPGGFAASALGHELGHCAIGAAGMDDPKHVWFDWSTWDREVRTRLRANGL